MQPSDFIGAGTRLTSDDINNAATALACASAAIQAVCTVETNGGGFLADGRPKILFEAKTFHSLTGGSYDDSNPNVSSAVWDRTLYGATGGHQYDRLAEAMTLDEDAALKSASWGMFQIMGENFSRCGYATVQDFVADMVDCEGKQLYAFCKFVAADQHMHTALVAHDWPTLARLYNGPGYASNHYDTKLAAAFDSAQQEA